MMTMTLPFGTGTNILESLRLGGVVDTSKLDLVTSGYSVPPDFHRKCQTQSPVWFYLRLIFVSICRLRCQYVVFQGAAFY